MMRRVSTQLPLAGKNPRIFLIICGNVLGKVTPKSEEAVAN